MSSNTIKPPQEKSLLLRCRPLCTCLRFPSNIDVKQYNFVFVLASRTMEKDIDINSREKRGRLVREGGGRSDFGAESTSKSYPLPSKPILISVKNFPARVGLVKDETVAHINLISGRKYFEVFLYYNLSQRQHLISMKRRPSHLCLLFT